MCIRDSRCPSGRAALFRSEPRRGPTKRRSRKTARTRSSCSSSCPPRPGRYGRWRARPRPGSHDEALPPVRARPRRRQRSGGSRQRPGRALVLTDLGEDLLDLEVERLPLEEERLQLGEDAPDFRQDPLELLFPEERIEVGGAGRDREARHAGDGAEGEEKCPLPESVRNGIRPAPAAVVLAPENLCLRKGGCRVGSALEKGRERDVSPGLRRPHRHLSPEPVGGLEHGGQILLIVSEQQTEQGNAEGVQIGWRAEIREDTIAGAGKLRAEREAEAAKAALLEVEKVARKNRLVGANVSGRRPDGEARETEAESRIRERQEDRVARSRRGIETCLLYTSPSPRDRT